MKRYAQQKKKEKTQNIPHRCLVWLIKSVEKSKGSFGVCVSVCVGGWKDSRNRYNSNYAICQISCLFKNRKNGNSNYLMDKYVSAIISASLYVWMYSCTCAYLCLCVWRWMSSKKQRDTAQQRQSSLLRNVGENKQLKPILRKRLIAVRPLKRGGEKIHTWENTVTSTHNEREYIWELC